MGIPGWTNNVLLKKAGITKAFLSSSEVLRKYYGFNKEYEPNGFVADSGFGKIDAVLPNFNTSWLLAGTNAMEYNNSIGITALLDPAAGNIKNADSNNILKTYKLLAQQNKLTTHVVAIVVANADSDAMKQVHILKSLQQEYKSVKKLKVIGFKIFADGVAEYPTQTAAFSKPYLNKLQQVY